MQLQVCISISLYLYLLLFKVYGKKVKHSVMDCSPVLDGCFRGSQTPSTSFLPLVILCFLCTWVTPPRLIAMIFYLIIKKLIFFLEFYLVFITVLMLKSDYIYATTPC